MKIVLVCGARPNFMKIVPIVRELRYRMLRKKKKMNLNYILVHTGQHYDDEMSKIFFEDLRLPKPDIYLGVGSGTHAEQTANIMIAFEKVCLEEKPDLVVVVGDVNSTLACSIVAAKLCIPIAHVKAGLRSFDRSMPEEINRVITDSLSHFLFTTCENANQNLKKEGIPEERIFFVGNVMIDTLIKFKEKAKKSKILESLNLVGYRTSSLNPSYFIRDYAILTLHRPSNVDNKETFQRIIKVLKKISKYIPIIFPIHPRTYKMIHKFSLKGDFTFHKSNSVTVTNSINIIRPLGYLDFLQLMSNAKFILTDSGGIQEETTILNIPCLTLRENTERPVTVREGTNTIVGTDPQKIISESIKILEGQPKIGRIPKLWDGKAAERIVNILEDALY